MSFNIESASITFRTSNVLARSSINTHSLLPSVFIFVHFSYYEDAAYGSPFAGVHQ